MGIIPLQVLSTFSLLLDETRSFTGIRDSVTMLGCLAIMLQVSACLHLQSTGNKNIRPGLLTCILGMQFRSPSILLTEPSLTKPRFSSLNIIEPQYCQPMCSTRSIPSLQISTTTMNKQIEWQISNTNGHKLSKAQSFWEVLSLWEHESEVNLNFVLGRCDLT